MTSSIIELSWQF